MGSNCYATHDFEILDGGPDVRSAIESPGGGRVSLGRTFAVVVVATMLTATLVTASVVAAAHLTVLDPDFVTNSIAEEGGYDVVEEATQGVAAAQPPGAGTGPVDANALLQDALSEEYVAAQTEANVHRLYAYLHGNSETLNLSISTAPIRENVSAAVEAQVRNASIAELVAGSNATLDGPVDPSMLDRMTANRSSYREVKSEFRAGVREQVLDAAVERAFRNRSNDELLNLVVEDYDPSEYSEEEKAQMVDEREDEIRVALRERAERERSDEIDEAVDEQLSTIREEATNASAETEAEEAAVAIQATVVRGLTTDASYQTFQSDLSEAKADLAAVVAARADARLAAEMPDRIDLTERMDGEAKRSFEQARTGVQWLDRLAFVLPVVALGLVGLLYSLRRSIPGVASGTGWSMLAAGLPALVGVQFAQSRLQALVDRAPAEQEPTLDVLVGVVGRVANTVGDVALVLTVGGVLLVAGSLAVRYGLVDRLREGLGDGSDDRGML